MLLCISFVNKTAEKLTKAQEFNMQPMALSFYPTGTGIAPASPIKLDNTDIINITAFKKSENGNGYVIRLFNPTNKANGCTLSFYDVSTSVDFGPFEIKTLRCSDNAITEIDLMEELLEK